jgi:hypothetical protein
MSNLNFPQLSSGAMAQYPIRKSNTLRTIKNLMADGSMLVAADPGAGQLVWTLSYIDLSTTDVDALQAHFVACAGPLRAFMFLDPTDNLLLYSADIAGAAWTVPTGITIQAGLPDPLGGSAAVSVTNTSSAPQQIVQAVAAPVGYQYCFSVYAASTSGGTCSMGRASSNDQQTNSYALGTQWSRLSSSGKLNDTGTGITVAITLPAGQTVSLFGPQLEPQIAPSRFRPTYSNSGLYLNAHWATPELVFTADAPNLFSSSFSIETSVWN